MCHCYKAVGRWQTNKYVRRRVSIGKRDIYGNFFTLCPTYACAGAETWFSRCHQSPCPSRTVDCKHCCNPGSCDDISQIVVMLLVVNENLNDYGTTTAQSVLTLGRVVVGTVAYIIRPVGCPDETVVHNVLVAN